jgi:ABC-type Fe3+ transport system substrate-binding protein
VNERELRAGRLLPLWIGIVVLLVGACAPTARPEPAAGPPPAASSAGGDTAWQAEWERTVAAARQEGTLALSAPASELWRRTLLSFEQEYPDVKVEYNGFPSGEFWPRLAQERAAGLFLRDLRVGGPSPEVFHARDAGTFAPVRPALVLPEVVGDDNWVGGLDGIWADDAKTYLLAFTANAMGTVSVNRDLISERELSAEKDLLDPRWRGKMSLQEPSGGAGLADLTVLVASYGEDYLRALLRQDLALTKDPRQQAEWIARGRYPIGLGVPTHVLLLLQNEGVGTNVKKLSGGQQGLTISTGAIQLMDRPPHPNATKVFVNWLLSQRTQAQLSQTVGLNSRRRDVPAAKPEEVVDPSQLDKYVSHQDERWLPARQRVLEIVNELPR